MIGSAVRFCGRGPCDEREGGGAKSSYHSQKQEAEALIEIFTSHRPSHSRWLALLVYSVRLLRHSPVLLDTVVDEFRADKENWLSYGSRNMRSAFLIFVEARDVMRRLQHRERVRSRRKNECETLNNVRVS